MYFPLDKRRHNRLSCCIPCLIFLTTSNKTETGWGIIYDLSLGGARLHTRLNIDGTNEIFLSFQIYNNFQFEKVKCRIVRYTYQGIYRTLHLNFVNLFSPHHLANALTSLLHNCLD